MKKEKKGEILISIIMPVYNNERYFPYAVRSVLGQELDDRYSIELIIVDDGSTDRTPEIADQFASKDDRVKVIHQENQWIYASFNNGIEEANGKYIYILNSDDKLYAHTLKYLQEKIREYHEPDIVFTRIVVCACDDEQNVFKTWNLGDPGLAAEIKENYYNSAEDVRENWLYFKKCGLISSQANLYKRELALKHPFRTEFYAADAIYNMEIAGDVNDCLTLNKDVYMHLLYGREDMNAATGKYYGNEHAMWNELFLLSKRVYSGWGILDFQHMEAIKTERIAWLCYELSTITSGACKLTLEEKIRVIFQEEIDDIIMECFGNERREELDSRLLCSAKELFFQEEPDRNSPVFFAFELVEALFHFESNHEDLMRIKKGVYHTDNPWHIGERFYERLEKNCLFSID
ncbi:MAG: glycosyltransferase family 2 protein [Lachnospiraceae bacterium]|nr:glycosyltransferase family 2 protein [Lachnospiraceae bacterium]